MKNKWDAWEKWIDSKWFLQGVAFLLAVMLFFSATWEGELEKKSLLGSKAETETVNNVPLELYYDQQNLVVTGAPANVTVDLTGPTNIAKSASVQKQFSVYADLRDLSLGTHTVELKYKNASEKLSLEIIPETVTVQIQEKVTREFEIAVDYINRDKMKSGFTVDVARADPGYVKITGAKERIEKIALVKTIVDLNEADESFETDAKVLVYDAAGNPVDVDLEQEEVKVFVEVLNPSKELPVQYTINKPLEDGYALVSIEPEVEHVTVYGVSLKALNGLTQAISVPLDLSGVKETTELEVELPLPTGVTFLKPYKMKFLVTVEKEKERVIRNVRIAVDDLKVGQTVEFMQPESGRVDVTITGAPAIVDKVTAADIRVYFSTEGKESGTYQSNLELELPSHVKGVLGESSVEYEIK